ncbi:hypothetical protein LCL98_14050 [Rossellomorea aquimaris]|nr:hypothetical protein [Rossellomorea aquimaris]
MAFLKYLSKKEDFKKNFSYTSNEEGMTLIEVVFSMTFSFILIAAILTVYNINHFILFSSLNQTENRKDLELIENYLSSETTEEVTATIGNGGKTVTLTNTDTLELLYDGSNLKLSLNGIEKSNLEKVTNFSATTDNGSLLITFDYKDTDFTGRYTLLDSRFDEDKLDAYRLEGP